MEFFNLLHALYLLQVKLKINAKLENIEKYFFQESLKNEADTKYLPSDIDNCLST